MSTQHLQRLRDEIRDPDLLRWFDQAVQQWRDGELLERAMGLSGPRAVRTRNAAVRRVADLVDAAGELSLWRRAEEVRRHVSHFESVVWPRLRQQAGSDDLPPLKATLRTWLTVESSEGVRPIRNRRSIFEVIRTE